MDYCEGGDLSSRIKKARSHSKTFSEEQVLWWFTQGVQALKYIHDLHILHRDLKSGNFFLSKSGNMKMGDFGIAKVLDCTAACAQTQVGTPYYLCPEICKGKPYSWGSDIWAMGCILHEMCALRVPFDGHDLKSLILRITKAPTPELPCAYSKDLQDILNKLLNRNPSCRPDADEILEIPVVRDTVRKMWKEEPADQPNGSEADSDAHQKPESVVSSAVSSGQYSDSAGSFAKRDKVEYHSATHCEWLPATVTAVDLKGQILMDVKPNTWISLEMQADKVRPRKNANPPEAKAPKRPSVAAAAPRNAAYRAGNAVREAVPQSARRVSSARRPSAAGPEPTPRYEKPAPIGNSNRRPSSAEAAVGPKYARPPGVAAAHLGA
jgi:serine/threonine protein kinase